MVNSSNLLEKLLQNGYNSVEELQKQYLHLFADDYYTIYCVEDNEVENYKLCEPYHKLEYRNGAGMSDREEIKGPKIGHYSGGNYEEVLTTDTNPLEGIISTISPLGTKLKLSKELDVITVNIEKNKYTYVVLKTPSLKY